MTKLTEIEAAALRLSERERLHLAESLLGSLPPPKLESEVDAILAEAGARDAEIESGKINDISESAFWAGIRRARR